MFVTYIDSDLSLSFQIAGMMITYFVLLIQFKMPVNTNCACHVNGTVVMDNNTLLITQMTSSWHAIKGDEYRYQDVYIEWFYARCSSR